MSLRAIISITNGCVDARTWTKAMVEEQPIEGKPKACAECPLRKGGELEQGAKEAMEQATAEQLESWGRWGCHQASRPCAGMRRLLALMR